MNSNLFVKSILLVLVALLTGCSSYEQPENMISESEQLLLVSNALSDVSKKDIEKRICLYGFRILSIT